jgi:hypothetical protein
LRGDGLVDELANRLRLRRLRLNCGQQQCGEYQESMLHCDSSLVGFYVLSLPAFKTGAAAPAASTAATNGFGAARRRPDTRLTH